MPASHYRSSHIIIAHISLSEFIQLFWEAWQDQRKLNYKGKQLRILKVVAEEQEGGWWKSGTRRRGRGGERKEVLGDTKAFSAWDKYCSITWKLQKNCSHYYHSFDLRYYVLNPPFFRLLRHLFALLWPSLSVALTDAFFFRLSDLLKKKKKLYIFFLIKSHFFHFSIYLENKSLAECMKSCRLLLAFYVCITGDVGISGAAMTMQMVVMMMMFMAVTYQSDFFGYFSIASDMYFFFLFDCCQCRCYFYWCCLLFFVCF